MSDLPGFYCPYGFPAEHAACCGGYCWKEVGTGRTTTPHNLPLTLADMAFLAVLTGMVMREGYSETAIDAAEKARAFFEGKG